MNYISLKHLQLFFAALILGAGLMSCNDDDETGIVDEPDTLVGELQEDPDFSLLVEALDKSGLSSTLNSSDSNFTLLAPSDAAFIASGITSLDEYSADQLTNILQYHVLPGEVTFADLELGNVETLNGTVNLSQFGNRYFLNGEAEFTQINFGATNGIIHVIDGVLMPAQNPITSFISSEDDLSTLNAALERTGLAGTLAAEGPYTIFAPTNMAFERLLNELDVSSLDEVPTGQLTEILQYHVLSDEVFSTELRSGSVNTLLDEDFSVAFTNWIVLVDDNNTNDNAVIIDDNELGTNGIVHKIDRVLLPANN